MKLNDKATKWVAGGVLFGVLATLGFQYVIRSYQNKQTVQAAQRFVQGLEQAQDKMSYVKNFDFSSLVSVGLSQSKADDSQCPSYLYDDSRGLRDMMYAMQKAYVEGAYNYEGGTEEFLRLYNSVNSQYEYTQELIDKCQRGEYLN